MSTVNDYSFFMSFLLTFANINVSKGTYYRWERELLTGVRRNGTPPSTTVTFAELPAPKQVSRNVAERCATLHIGSASLDIYSGCNAEQLKMLVELLRPC